MAEGHVDIPTYQGRHTGDSSPPVEYPRTLSLPYIGEVEVKEILRH